MKNYIIPLILFVGTFSLFYFFISPQTLWGYLGILLTTLLVFALILLVVGYYTNKKHNPTDFTQNLINSMNNPTVIENAAFGKMISSNVQNLKFLSDNIGSDLMYGNLKENYKSYIRADCEYIILCYLVVKKLDSKLKGGELDYFTSNLENNFVQEAREGGFLNDMNHDKIKNYILLWCSQLEEKLK